MEYSKAIESTDLQSYATRWMNFTNIMLRDKQDTKEYKLYDYELCEV